MPEWAEQTHYVVGTITGRADVNTKRRRSIRYRSGAVLRGGCVRVPRQKGKLSVFALDTVCHGVGIRGTKYDVENIDITSAFPLGMGNDFMDDEAEISVADGALLVMVNPKT